jgi:hypothetical protein
VYGPQLEADKLIFLNELNALQHYVQREWLVVGDFNMIYKDKNKNNSRLNSSANGQIQVILGQSRAQRAPSPWEKVHLDKLQLCPSRSDDDKDRPNVLRKRLGRAFPISSSSCLVSTVSDQSPLSLKGTLPLKKSRASDSSPTGSKSQGSLPMRRSKLE